MTRGIEKEKYIHFNRPYTNIRKRQMDLGFWVGAVTMLALGPVADVVGEMVLVGEHMPEHHSEIFPALWCRCVEQSI